MDEPKLSACGNPIIPKGEGRSPVQAYIAAMPGWKSGIGKRIDEMVRQAYPEVTNAVKWNTPFYGKSDGWFLAMYCYKKHVQLTFMRGTRLKPNPPVKSKVEDTRYFNIYEDDDLDEVQVADWIRQALKLPGEKI